MKKSALPSADQRSEWLTERSQAAVSVRHLPPRSSIAAFQGAVWVRPAFEATKAMWAPSGL